MGLYCRLSTMLWLLGCFFAIGLFVGLGLGWRAEVAAMPEAAREARAVPAVPSEPRLREEVFGPWRATPCWCSW